MSKEILIYLYSNFSKSCAEFKTQINFLSNYLKIISVNIDSKKVRKIILNSKKIKVEYVPCLLIMVEVCIDGCPPNSQVHPRRPSVGLVEWKSLLRNGCGRRV